MKVLKKAYKYKLKTNKSQEQILSSWIHTCRAVYNLALETKIYAYKANKTSLSVYDLKKEFDWIKDVQSQVLQETLFRLDKAYKSFFKGGGFPKYASRDNSHKYEEFRFEYEFEFREESIKDIKAIVELFKK